MRNSVVLQALKFVLVDVIGDFLYMPIWWYTEGLKKVALFFSGSLVNEVNRLALPIWLKNMFTPMYGDYTIAGRLISFFMRFFILIYRLIIFVIWFAILTLILVVWLIVPPLSVVGIVFNLG
jgi:hypothetical protein